MTGNTSQWCFLFSATFLVEKWQLWKELPGMVFIPVFLTEFIGKRRTGQ